MDAGLTQDDEKKDPSSDAINNLTAQEAFRLYSVLSECEEIPEKPSSYNIMVAMYVPNERCVSRPCEIST